MPQLDTDTLVAGLAEGGQIAVETEAAGLELILEKRPEPPMVLGVLGPEWR